MCKIVLLDFVRCLDCKIIDLRRFRSWILLPSSRIRGAGGQKTYLLGPLASDLV
jgi:hypothetical protein